MTVVLALGVTPVDALPPVGTAASWGANTAGQLGNGTTTWTSTPGAVNGLTDVAAIAAGGSGSSGHTLALRKDGTVWAWGRNGFGQLGNGCVIGMTCTDKPTPVPVPGLSDVIAIAAGTGHSLAMLADGRVRAWGQNDSGQLGNGSTTPSSTPVSVVSDFVFLGARAIAAGGRHSLAILKDGRIVAWGENEFGQLGDGTVTDRKTPSLVAASPLTGYTGVAAGSQHSLARLKDGRVFSWGRNHQGQLGHNNFIDSPVPVPVPGLNDVVGIAAAFAHSLALRVGRTVTAWGSNTSGQLGNGSSGLPSPAPVAVSNLADVVAIAAGGRHSLAVTVEGELFGWGNNVYGQLGFPAPTTVLTPSLVTGVSSVTTVAAGYSYTLVASVRGTLLSWGDASWAGYGAFDSRSVPGQVDRATWATSVAAGMNYFLAATAGGRVLAAGRNNEGQLGDNGSSFDGTSFSPLPVYVRRQGGLFLNQIVAVSAFSSGATSLAADLNGAAWGWGQNNDGQVGDGTVGAPKLFAVKVNGLDGVRAVAAGQHHSLALRNDGTLRAWGNNVWGQLGTGGLPTNFPTPQGVGGLPHVIAIGAGQIHSLAVDTSGVVWAWGDNTNGQLGDGCQIGVNCVNSFVPKQVPGLPPAVAVAGGVGWSMALTASGQVWAWGANNIGQLGNGCTIFVDCVDSSVPAPVGGPGLANVVAIAAGHSHAVAVDAGGTVFTWGQNDIGQLGDGCTITVNCVPHSAPLPVLQLFVNAAKAPIAAGYVNTFLAAP